MTLIRPFAALRPQAAFVEQVVAPPYDVLNAQEARVRAQGKPWSFLHISRPEIDLALDCDPYADEVYAKAAENLAKMLNAKVLKQDSQACYYLYGLIMGRHQQIGLVTAASVPDYNKNRIRKHEFTRPDKENDRVRQIDALNAQTGPVLLAYKQHPVIAQLIARISQQPPEVTVTADDGIIHSLWPVTDARDIETITQTFDPMDALYIADGHHRSAAASRVAAQRQQANPHHTGEENYNYFLSVMFPDSQMNILDYNRIIKDLNGLSADEFLSAIGKNFTVTPATTPVKPSQAGEFGLYLNQQWYQLNIHPENIPDDPIKRLDVSLLADFLIAPILGITDPRRDKRIDFVGGIRGLAGLVQRVDSGEMAVAFSLYPTCMAELMAVADANEVMPPKSTWFEPKLVDGLVSHLIEAQA